MYSAVRKSWMVMYASVFAIIIRDIQKKFIKSVNTHRPLAVLWIIIEPMIHIGIWMLIRTVIKDSIHSNLPPPLFILLGAIPFLLFRNVVTQSKSCIKSNKNFFLFRQIKPVDPMIAGLISELLISSFVFLVILIFFKWFGIPWHIYKFLLWLFTIVAYVLFLLGLYVIISVACFFFNFLNTVVSIFLRLFYIFSGVFFSADMLPKLMRDILLYNPLFQFIELTRECFMPIHSYIPYGSSTYLIKVAVITLMFGMSLYLATRHKIMMEIEQR